MPSFDVVCKLDMHEISNAVDQASREIGQRYDFRGTNATIEKTAEGIVIVANAESRLSAALEVLHSKLAKRDVSLKSLDAGAPKPAGGSTWRQVITLKEGVDQENAKRIVKLLKDSKLKVQASIQGDLVRVSHKNRDLLQQAIALLKAEDYPLPLQYQNFRD